MWGRQFRSFHQRSFTIFFGKLVCSVFHPLFHPKPLRYSSNHPNGIPMVHINASSPDFDRSHLKGQEVFHSMVDLDTKLVSPSQQAYQFWSKPRLLPGRQFDKRVSSEIGRFSRKTSEGDKPS